MNEINDKDLLRELKENFNLKIKNNLVDLGYGAGSYTNGKVEKNHALPYWAFKGKLFFNKNYPDGTRRKVLDNKIMKNLGWSPKISLEHGLSNTIKWYKKNYL